MNDNEQTVEKKPVSLRDISLGILGVSIILAIFAFPMLYLLNFLLPVVGIERQVEYQHTLAFAVLLFCMGRCVAPAK